MLTERSSEERQEITEMLVRELGERYEDIIEMEFDMNIEDFINKEEIIDEEGTLAHIEEVGKQIGANDELQLSFSDTKYAQATEFETMEQAQTAFTEATQTMVDNLDTAYGDHEADIEESLNQVGLTLGESEGDYTNFKEHVQEQLTGSDGVVAQSEEAAESTEQMKDDMIESFGNAADAITTWQEKYSEKIGLAIDSNDKLIESLDDLIEKLGEASQAQAEHDSNSTTGGGGGTGGNSGGVNNVAGSTGTENADSSESSGGNDSENFNWAKSG